MDDYEAFCLTDPVFYDQPGAGASDVDDLLPAAERPLPAGWHRSPMGIWSVVQPAGAELPAQGWKVHVSACPHNARRVLARTWDHCIEHGLCFKFLRSTTALLAQNTKYADRSGSGKFVTIYPPDEARLELTLRRLGDALRGEPGPYVLSDLRWEDGPLYVRYGGFVDRQVRTDAGALVAAIEDPDGRLVPDERLPVFRPPSWVQLPPFLAEQRARAASGADAAGSEADAMPYVVEEALHFSNGGGVYRARDPRTGRSVVLKEARPLAGLDREGGDAVRRLQREHRALAALAGLDCVPELIELRTWWEHHFLVEEHLDGATLAEEVVARHPLLTADAGVAATVDFTDWALAVLDAVEDAVTAIHGRGFVFGDLHPHNVLVRPDGSVALVDFELSSPVGEGWEPSLGAPGFAAPPDRRGFDVDRFALGCLRLSLFLPLTPLLSWDPDKLDELISAIEHRFPVPAGFGDRVRRDLGAGAAGTAPAARPSEGSSGWRHRTWPVEAPPRWPAVRGSMAAAILASATPERQDRLFPGDPMQSVVGGLGLAHGAAGVLWALQQTGVQPPVEHVDWLVRAVRRQRDELAPGLYDGLTGIAYALDGLGRRELAGWMLADALSRPRDPADASLFSGLAGIALGALLLADRTGDERHLRTARALADQAVAALDDRPELLPDPGLLHGWSGVALLLLRLHDRTGDAALLDQARRAVDADLAGCVWTEDRTLQVDQGWRVLPYLAVGSAGVGLVLQDLLGRTPGDERLHRAQAGIRRAATGDLVIQPGLANGRAGLLLYLGAIAGPDDPAVQAHLVTLAWHAVPYRGHIAFVGDQLMRLSMDLATGSAGVLVALASVLGARPVSLPFVRPAPAGPTTGTPCRAVGPGAPRAIGRR